MCYFLSEKPAVCTTLNGGRVPSSVVSNVPIIIVRDCSLKCIIHFHSCDAAQFIPKLLQFCFAVQNLFVQIKYRIFSIKRPRRLFQSWPGGPGVYLNQQFIWARHFLREEFYSFYLTSSILPLHLMRRSIRKFNIPPPRETPGHLNF